jgi:hypothetical protein
VHDRYSLRIARFFTWNPRLADQWLAHAYFEVRALAARHANLFRLSALLQDPEAEVRVAALHRLSELRGP